MRACPDRRRGAPARRRRRSGCRRGPATGRAKTGRRAGGKFRGRRDLPGPRSRRGGCRGRHPRKKRRREWAWPAGRRGFGRRSICRGCGGRRWSGGDRRPGRSRPFPVSRCGSAEAGAGRPPRFSKWPRTGFRRFPAANRRGRPRPSATGNSTAIRPAGRGFACRRPKARRTPRPGTSGRRRRRQTRFRGARRRRRRQSSSVPRGAGRPMRRRRPDRAPGSLRRPANRAGSRPVRSRRGRGLGACPPKASRGAAGRL